MIRILRIELEKEQNRNKELFEENMRLESENKLLRLKLESLLNEQNRGKVAL